MKIINLINPELSMCKYTVSKFPDGETHIKFNDELNRKEDYRVVCRITNAEDLFILMQTANILNNNGVLWSLRIAYLMGMRMDRIMTFKEPFTLKIIADIINSLGAYSVYVFHPHSDRAIYDINGFNFLDGACINLMEFESRLYSSIPYWDQASERFANFKQENLTCAICYPDKGASKRYQFDYGYFYNDVANKPEIITLNKVRDVETGLIKNIEFVNPIKDIDYDVITVVDDLCDGGGTFSGTESLLRSQFPNAMINIYIRHMVNPKGIDVLANKFDNVYFTNSFKSWEKDNQYNNVHVIDIISDISKLDEIEF